MSLLLPNGRKTKMKQETRNSEPLRDFVEYCANHPDQRFWQALRNWSGAEKIMFDDALVDFDTFYWEGKDK